MSSCTSRPASREPHTKKHGTTLSWQQSQLGIISTTVTVLGSGSQPSWTVTSSPFQRRKGYLPRERSTVTTMRHKIMLPATHAFGVIQPCRGERDLLLLVYVNWRVWGEHCLFFPGKPAASDIKWKPTACIKQEAVAVHTRRHHHHHLHVRK